MYVFLENNEGIAPGKIPSNAMLWHCKLNRVDAFHKLVGSYDFSIFEIVKFRGDHMAEFVRASIGHWIATFTFRLGTHTPKNFPSSALRKARDHGGTLKEATWTLGQDKNAALTLSCENRCYKAEPYNIVFHGYKGSANPSAPGSAKKKSSRKEMSQKTGMDISPIATPEPIVTPPQEESPFPMDPEIPLSVSPMTSPTESPVTSPFLIADEMDIEYLDDVAVAECNDSEIVCHVKNARDVVGVIVEVEGLGRVLATNFKVEDNNLIKIQTEILQPLIIDMMELHDLAVAIEFRFARAEPKKVHTVLSQAALNSLLQFFHHCRTVAPYDFFWHSRI
eukprot:TRINITY_DN830_c0_g1_i1.p1 TRINITY_DN830_c0_g1~~TRINITY_DN830_c0_g1_i1.p1  ORF type:complete len:336 (-),score=41.73 TRINITY_DN830_c0_g1_i1:79-1086(-)